MIGALVAVGELESMQAVPTAAVCRRPYPLLGVLALSLTALLALGACGDIMEPQLQTSAPPERVFRAGFVDLQEIYIDELDLASITETSVTSLSSIEPGITVTRDSGAIQVIVGTGSPTAYQQPPAGDAEAWGALTGEMVRHLQNQSAALGSSDSERIYETVFDAVVRGLDPYSRYSSREEAHENRASRDGFGGIGVRIDVLPEGIKVLSVMENTPAATAGVLDGDLILSIDGQPAAGIDQREAVDRLRGRVGSAVRLGIQRDAKLLDIMVTRAHIVPQTVKGSLKGNIAIVELSSFNHSTSEVLQDKIETLAAAAPGGRLGGLVLDLRGNPGGLLDQSVEVADLFLGNGVIVTTHGRHPDSHQYFEANGDQIVPGVPMVILVNGTAASASEIVASALQDQGRAVVVGSSTYGKGTVQTVLRLPNDGELTLTWARFHAPSGYALNARGVLPDLCTSSSASLNAVLQSMQRGDSPLARALQQTEVDEDDKPAVAAFRAHCPTVEDSPPVDLEVALALLNDQRLFAKAIGGRTSAALQ
jgi:carboxyl-terminal processing protease